MKSKVVFLDRDGTLNVEKNYLYKISDFEWIPGALIALNMFIQMSYKLVIITNQSGIAKGLYTEEQFNCLNNWMVSELKKNGIQIEKVYYCPHHPEALIERYRTNCKCRKPKLGLFDLAEKELDIDVENSIAIGDRVRDLEICFERGCQGFLIGETEKKKCINKIRSGIYGNILYFSNILEIAKYVYEIKKIQEINL